MRKTALALFAIIAASAAFAVPGTISGYTGTKTEVYLPAIFEGAAVTNIADHAFLNKDAITGIYAPDSVRTVGLYAFQGCASLLAVRLDGVHNVGGDAFYECRALTCISLPAVTNIGASAWYECTALTNVVLGATVEYIGARAFLGCTNLQSVMFSGSPPATGGDVFSNAPNVTVIITEPTASGWGTTFAGRPVVRYAVYGTNTDAHMATHGVTAEGGFAGGDRAAVSLTGGAVGEGALALTGGAAGSGAVSSSGGAAGEGAYAIEGGAIGLGTSTSSGFAGGQNAKAHDGINPIDAIQLGTGINPDAQSLQVYDYKLMDADGTVPVERIPAAITNGLLSAVEADASYLSATPGWFWQGSQAVLTNDWSATLGGYAVTTNGETAWALVPYTTERHDVTGSVEIVSGTYIVGVGVDWYVAVPEDLSIPKTPVRTASERLGPTSWVLRAWCSTAAADANSSYFAVASNVTVMTYDRQEEMTPGLYTNDAAGIVSRVDDAPTTDARRAVNVGTMTAYVDGRKDEIADRAWRRTPGGRDAPSAYTVTIDQPLVQQGAMSWLNSGNYYCMSYDGGDWYSSTTGSTWRVGPGGTVAFEIMGTNRVLHVQALSVADGYATLDISTNWVVGAFVPEIRYTDDLENPQWLTCPEQTMTNAVSFWRGVCPATADKRFFQVVLPSGASLIKSHYAHEFASDIILFGQRYASLAELKAALEALP